MARSAAGCRDGGTAAHCPQHCGPAENVEEMPGLISVLILRNSCFSGGKIVFSVFRCGEPSSSCLCSVFPCLCSVFLCRSIGAVRTNKVTFWSVLEVK